MKILVTGNMGYIGPPVIRQLRSSYPDVIFIGLDMGYFAHCLFNSTILPEASIDVQYFTDVRNFPSDILSGVTAVVHLAAISNDPMGNIFEEVTFDINHHATVRLAKLSKEAGVKIFVLASSCSIYGQANDDRTEESPLNPLTAYAKSKVMAEENLKQLADEHFKVTSLRFGTACGMSPRLRLDLVLNDFVACAIATGQITILSDGTPWRPLIHVRDMARAIDWAISREISQADEFLAINVGKDMWNYQVKDLAEAVAGAVPGTEVSISQDAQPDKRSYCVNFELYRHLAPKHQPQMDLLSTIIELKNVLERENFRDRNFRNSSFMRLQVLLNLRKKKLLTDQLVWASP